MIRDRVLRVVLVLVGLMLLSGVISLLHYNNPEKHSYLLDAATPMLAIGLIFLVLTRARATASGRT